MPWHILPRKSADRRRVAAARPPVLRPDHRAATFPIQNKGVGDAQMFAYSLLGTGTDRPGGGRGEQAPTPDLRAVGTNTFVAPAGFCTAGTNFIWEFAFNMFERQANPQGTWYEVDLDMNNDGITDFFVYTRDVSGDHDADGRSRGDRGVQRRDRHAVAALQLLLRGARDQLVHSRHARLRQRPGSQLADIGRPMVADFRVTSWYWGTPESHLGPYLITPLGEEFTASVPGDVVSYGQKTSGTVQQWDPFPGLTPYTGLMLITNSAFSATNNGGSTGASEAILLQR